MKNRLAAKVIMTIELMKKLGFAPNNPATSQFLRQMEAEHREACTNPDCLAGTAILIVADVVDFHIAQPDTDIGEYLETAIDLACLPNAGN